MGKYISVQIRQQNWTRTDSFLQADFFRLIGSLKII